MAKFCPKCGEKLNDDAAFCTKCGEKFDTAKKEVKAEKVAKKDTKAENKYKEEDKLYCVICYLSLLALIPLLSKKDDEFLQFHSKQGLNATIAAAIGMVALAILAALFAFIPVIGFVLSILLYIALIGVDAFYIVIIVLGIIAACKGEMKQLPLMDKFKFIK